jgi:hypothetical protein
MGTAASEEQDRINAQASADAEAARKEEVEA